MREAVRFSAIYVFDRETKLNVPEVSRVLLEGMEISRLSQSCVECSSNCWTAINFKL